MMRTLLILLSALIALAQDAGPWKAADLMQPETLAARLKDGSPAPVILYVGFPVLYRGAHIPGALMAGPGSKPEGMDALKQHVARLPKNASIVLYCGCCPFEKCPNVRPAFRTLKDMGYTNVKLVVIPTNLSTDWVQKGFPIDKAAVAPAGQ